MERTRRKRWPVVLTAGLTLGVLLSACGGRASFEPVSGFATPTEGKDFGGDAVSPAAGVPGNQRYLFRTDKPPVAVRQASKDLLAAMPQIIGLRAIVLSSTADAAALYMTEDAPGTPWNSLLERGRKPVLEAFAKDKSMGDWLVLVTDVVVRDAPQDPAPPNAYRWPRAQVEEFARCGIPAQGRNECSDRFFQQADADGNHIVLAAQGGPIRGR